jgi:hypothetical protein
MKGEKSENLGFSGYFDAVLSDFIDLPRNGN